MSKSNSERKVKVHVTRHGGVEVDLRSMLMNERFQKDLDLLGEEEPSSSDTASNLTNKEIKPNPTG